MATTFRDYYDVLGVPRTATDKEIKSAFRKLARRYHPDVNGGDKAAEARFKEANEANEVLSDPEKRRKYDEFGRDWQRYEQWEAAGRPGPSPFGTSAQPFGGGGGGPQVEYRTVSPEEMEQLFGSTSFSSFFHDLFGAPPSPSGQRRATGPERGEDIHARIQVPLRLAIAGGEVEVPTPRGGRVRLRIPAGTQNGRVLRLRGQGRPGLRGGAGGDLLAEVEVRLPVPPDPELRAWAEKAKG